MRDPTKRPTTSEILAHPFFNDTPSYTDILDEQEKDLIRKEFTYGEDDDQVQEDIDEDQRAEIGQLKTQFTEMSIESKDKD